MPFTVLIFFSNFIVIRISIKKDSHRFDSEFLIHLVGHCLRCNQNVLNRGTSQRRSAMYHYSTLYSPYPKNRVSPCIQASPPPRTPLSDTARVGFSNSFVNPGSVWTIGQCQSERRPADCWLRESRLDSPVCFVRISSRRSSEFFWIKEF